MTSLERADVAEVVANAAKGGDGWHGEGEGVGVASGLAGNAVGESQV